MSGPLPPDEFTALRSASATVGHLPAAAERGRIAETPAASPASDDTSRVPPSGPERSRQRAGMVPDEAVDAALAADAGWAKAHPIGPTWTRPPREQVRRLIAAEWERAETAETKLAEITEACRSIPSPIANRLLAIIGTEEKGGVPYDRDFDGPVL